MYLKLTYWSIFFLIFGVFVSISLLPVQQLLILLPIIYYVKKDFKVSELRTSQIFLFALCIITIFSNIVNYSELEIALKAFLKIKFYIIGLLAIYPLQRLTKEYLTPKNARFLLNSLCFVLIAAFLYGFVKSKLGFDLLKFELGEFGSRSAGFTKIMRYGYGSGMILSLLVGVWLHRDKLNQLVSKRFFTIALIAGIAGLYISMCRGAILGFVLALPVSIYFFNKKVGVYLSIISVTLVAIIAAISIFGGSSQSRLFMKMNSESNTIRLSQYQSALYAIMEKPVLGYGNLQLSYEVPRIKQKYNLQHKNYASHAHNIFLETGANTGILGLLCLVGFFAFWLKEMLFGGFWQRQLFVPFLICLLISGQFENIFDSNNSALIFFLYALSFVKLPEDYIVKR